LALIPATAFAGHGDRGDNGSGMEFVAITVNGGPQTIVDSDSSHKWLTNGTYSDVNIQIVNDTTLSLSVETSNGTQYYTAVLSDGYVFDANSTISYSGVNSQSSTYDNIVINVTATEVSGGGQPPVVIVDPEGSLRITKTASEGYTVPASAVFTVKSAAGITVATVTYADFTDGVYVVEGLIPGSYTVEETGGEIEGVIWTYSVSYADGAAAVVTDGGEAAVEVFNTYEPESVEPPVDPPVNPPVEEPEYTSVTVRKAWVLDNEGKAVPVSVQLYSNEVPYGDPVELSEANNWTCTWEGLLVDGSVYTVEEIAVEGFTVSQTVAEDGAIVITNDDIAKEEPPVPPQPPVVEPEYTSLTVQKVWKLDDGGSATEYVKVQLYKDGEPQGAVKLSEANGWSYTWAELEAGYTYNAIEVAVPDGFTASQEVAEDGTIIIINDDIVKEEPPVPPQPPVEPEYTSITVRKAWILDNGGEAVPVSVQLFKNGVAYDIPAVLSEANNWTCTWEGLLVDGSVYTVEEITVEGFTVSYGEDENGTIVITNDDIAKEEPPVDPPVNPPVEPPYYPPYIPPYVPPVVPEEPAVEPPVVIEEPEVPLADEPVETEEPVEIEEPEAPLAEAPKTGDNMMTWAMMAILSLAGLAAVSRKRENN